jgi:hypothetical protein
MIPINEVHVGVTGRTEHRLIARALATETVTRGIVFEVSLGLDDCSTHDSIRSISEEKMA